MQAAPAQQHLQAWLQPTCITPRVIQSPCAWLAMRVSASQVLKRGRGCLQVFAGDGRLLEDGDRLVLAHHLVQVMPANALRWDLH